MTDLVSIVFVVNDYHWIELISQLLKNSEDNFREIPARF